MKKFDGILKNARVVSPENGIDEIFDIEIKSGIVTAIGKTLAGRRIIDMSGKIIMPAFVEMHCHLREPGFEEKETVETGVNSAIAGGYAAICPMANTNPVNDNIETLKFIRNASDKIGIFPICAVTKGLSSGEIVDFKLLKEAGAIAFSNDGKPLEDMDLLKKVLLKAKAEDVLIISHAEDTKYAPEQNESEFSAVLRELDAVRETDARYHFAHISTAESLGLIHEAKHEGWNVTCESAPHYFTLSKDDIIDNHARFKMNPPLRSEADKEAVIEGFLDGTIDVVATDHAPHTIEEKNLPFERAPMGIVGFETAFSLAYERFVRTNLLTLSSIVKKFSSNPAKILGLKEFGGIEIGQYANLAIFDPDFEWTVEAAKFRSKCKISPFEGRKLKGKITAAIAKGVFYENEPPKPVQSDN